MRSNFQLYKTEITDSFKVCQVTWFFPQQSAVPNTAMQSSMTYSENPLSLSYFKRGEKPQTMLLNLYFQIPNVTAYHFSWSHKVSMAPANHHAQQTGL